MLNRNCDRCGGSPIPHWPSSSQSSKASKHTSSNLVDWYKAHKLAIPIEGHKALLLSKPDKTRTDQLEYQRFVGSLMYAMVATRPNITFAIGKLSQYSHV